MPPKQASSDPGILRVQQTLTLGGWSEAGLPWDLAQEGMSKRRFSERCLCDKNPYTQTHKSSKCKMCLVSWHRCFCMDILLILIESHCVTHVSCSIRGDDVQGYIQTAGEPDPVRNPRIRLLNYWLLVAHRASPLIDRLTQSTGVIPTLHQMVTQDEVSPYDTEEQEEKMPITVKPTRGPKLNVNAAAGWGGRRYVQVDDM